MSIKVKRPTDLGRQVLQAIVDSDYHDGKDPIDNWVWALSIDPGWSGTTGSRKLSGVLVNLLKNGWARQRGYGEDAAICITAEGFAALNTHKS